MAKSSIWIKRHILAPFFVSLAVSFLVSNQLLGQHGNSDDDLLTFLMSSTPTLTFSTDRISRQHHASKNIWQAPIDQWSPSAEVSTLSRRPVPFPIHSHPSGNVTLMTKERSLLNVRYSFHQKRIPKKEPTHNHQSAPTENFLLVGILSTASVLERRSAVRETWGKQVNAFFLVATPSLTAVDPSLVQEFEEYGDLLIIEHEESYLEVTIKTMALMSAATDFELPFTYLVKTDDDSHIRVPELVHWLGKYPKPMDFGGHCVSHMKIVRQIGSPYYVPPEILPIQFETYLPYASGAGYVLSPSSAMCLARNSAKQPYFPSEDANSGWILSFYCQVTCTQVDPINWYFDPYQSGKYFLQHYVPPGLMRVYHNQLANESVSVTTSSSNTLTNPPNMKVINSVSRTELLLTTGTVDLVNGMYQSYPKIHVQFQLDISRIHHESAEPKLVVAIFSPTQAADVRQAIRNTWAQNDNTAVYFLSNGGSSHHLIGEMLQYRDIFSIEMPPEVPSRASFVETVTTLAFYKAVAKHAKPPYWILKTVDSYVDVDGLLRHLGKEGGHYRGACLSTSGIIRRPDHGYYVPDHLLPGKVVFPEYAGGGVQLLSSEANSCIANTMVKEPFLPIDNANLGWWLGDFCNIRCHADDSVIASGIVHAGSRSYVFSMSRSQSILSAHSSIASKLATNLATREVIHGSVDVLMSAALGERRTVNYYIHEIWLNDAKAHNGKLLIVAVRETEKKFAKREATRELFRGMQNVKVVFLMKELNSALKFEQEHYRDLFFVKLQKADPLDQAMDSHVLVSFLHALTKHHEISFQFVLRATAHNVIFMNHDLFSSIGAATLAPPTDYVGAECHTESLIIRDPQNIWYLPPEQLPGQSYYPPHAPMPFFLSRNASWCLAESSKVTQIPFEDVHVGWFLENHCKIDCQEWVTGY